MEPESTEVPSDKLAESNLLAGTPADATNGQQKPPASIDDIPIGGGSKFKWSEFPQDGAPPPKPPARKPLPKKKKQEPKEVKEPEAPPTQSAAGQEARPPPPADPNSFDEKPIGRSNNFAVSQFPDERPVGKSNFNVSEFPEEEEPVNEKASNLTFEQKLKSKAIKIRLGAFEELLAMLTAGDSINDPPLSGLEWDKLLKETNPGCLEKILLSFQLWCQKDGSWGEEEVKQVIENGCTNGKGTSKKVASELVDYMYEKKPQACEAAILAGLKGKTIKTVTGYIAILNELLPIYGIKKLSLLKPYYPDVIRLISTEKLPAIKTQGMNLLKEAMKWLTKDFLEPYFKSNNLKEGLKKELDAFWETYDKTAVMTAPKMDPQTSKKGGAAGGKIDIYAESEEVDIFKKFNEKWSEGVLKAEKWKEKTDAMQQLVAAANVPRLANTDFRHITDMIKRLIIDSNINVVISVLKILGALAKGLRKNFSAYAKMFFPAVINKFKDKKTLLLQEANTCLNEFYFCLSIEDVVEDLKQGLADKNPGEKIHLMNWIDRAVQRKVKDRAFQEKGKDALRQLFPTFEKLCNDGAVEVRENTTKAICNMKASLGDDFFSAFEAKLGKTLTSKPGKGDKKQKEKDELAQTTMSLSTSSVMPKPPTQPTSTTNAMSKTMNFSKPVAPSKVEEKGEDYEMPTYEECYQTLLGYGLSEDDLKVVTAGTAKEKAALLEGLRNEEYNFEAVLKVIRKMYKDWKESNLVMNKEVMAFLASNVERIGKREFYVILPCLLEKISDSKFAEPVGTLTEALIQQIPPKFFAGQILKYLKPSESRKPSPKLNGDVCNYLCEVIDKVSLNYLSFKDLVEFAKECYQVPLSKKGAVSLFKKMYEYMGESLKTCLDEPTIKSMDPEFKKTNVLSEAEKRPKVEFRGQAKEEVKHEKVVNPLDSLPRADISNEVAKFLPKINDAANWQLRKEGIESLDALLSQNGHRVLMNGLTDLITALKGRINDPNKSLCKLFISFTAHLVESVGKDIRMHSKVLVLSLIEVLADKTEAIRKESVQSLTRIGNVLGMDLVVNCMGQPLESDKVQFRAEVLNFLLANEDYLAKIDGKEFAKGIVNCLCDKNKDIRSLSERLTEKVCDRIGMDYLRQVAKDFRPAFIKDLTAIFDRIDKNNGVGQVRSGSPSTKTNEAAKKPPISASKKDNPAAHSSTQNLAATLPSLSNSSVMARTMPQKTLADSGVTPTGNAFNGDEPLAGAKFLAMYRQQRQDQEQTVPWTYDNIKDTKEEELIEEINRSFRRDISSKMVALDYRKVVEAGMMISKMCKDLSLHNSLRELSDVIQKWILLRLWGGCLPAIYLMEIVPQILSVLEKKNVNITEQEVLLAIALIREYCVANASHEVRVNETSHTIIKCLIKLYSGDRLLKTLLKQYSVDLLLMHKHARRESNPYYRETLNRLIKNNLMDFVGNQEILMEISKIRELNRDAEFLEMLFQRFNETALHGYGFRRQNGVQNAGQHSSSVEKIQSPPSSTNLTNSQVRSNMPPPLPGRPNLQVPTVPHQPQLVQPGSTTNMHSSSLRKVDSQASINQQQQTPVVHTNNYINPQSMQQQTPPTVSQPVAEPTLLSRLNLSSFMCPHPSSPLSEHLSRLVPPNDETLTFFQTLFVQTSDKITTELQNYAKIILAAILKANIMMLERRNEYVPDKINNQLNLLQQTLKNRHVIRNVGEVLAVATEFVLKQLVYEDQNKAAIAESLRERGIDFKTDNFVKTINGVMLRILENAHPHHIIIILFDLLIKTLKRPTVSQKTVCLIVKCIGRVSNNYLAELEENNLVELILKFHQYCTELQGKLRPEDAGMKIIENMLTEVAKEVKENIWNSYEKAMSQSAIPDEFIARHLQALKVPYPEKNKPSQKEEELKKITELLSKYKTYEAGIGLLNSFLDQNPEFQIAQYFSNLNYDNKFINKVLNSLESNFKRPPPRGLVIPPTSIDRRSEEKKKSMERPSEPEENNIENKIRSLRQRFDQMHRNEEPPAPPQEADPDRASEIRRRITEMKAKINNSIR